VWFWIDGEITIHVLGASGYEPRRASSLVPQIDLDLIERLLELPTTNDAMRELRATLAKRP
jgi:hypothetical protein